MVPRRRLGGLFLVLGVIGAPGPLIAQEAAPDPGREWGLIFTPYANLASNATDVGGERLRQSFGDLAGLTDLGFQMRSTAYYRWAHFTVDWTFARLKDTQELGPAQVDFTVNQWIVDLGLGGRFYDDRDAGSAIGNSLYLRAGARYWQNDIDVLTTIGNEDNILPPVEIPFKEKQEWWDPMLTLAGTFGITETVGFGLKAAAGGLGIGNASNWVYDFEGLAHFKVLDWMMISTGYRQFSYNREDGEGDEAVETTVLVTGPQIGVSFFVF
jgi:hypothetical protein